MRRGTYVVCTACDGVNRLTSGDLTGPVACSGCAAPLFAGDTAHVSLRRFWHQVERSDIPILVEIDPEATLESAAGGLAARIGDQARILVLEPIDAPAMARRLAIEHLPALVLFHKGNPVGRHAADAGAEAILGWIRPRLEQIASAD